MPAHLLLRRRSVRGALVCCGLALAACSSPSGPSSSTTTSKASGHAATTTTTSIPTTGPLQAGAPVTVPLAATQVAAAEAPNGAVFVTTQDPTSAAPSVVWVVDGQSPAAVAEHVPAGVAGLAADGTNLYVATYHDVTAFDRSSGNQSGHWSLPPVNAANSSNDDLVSIAAAGGRVYVTITQGNSVAVYRIKPSSTALPVLVVEGLGATIGPDGTIYSERTDHHLVSMIPSGTITLGPLLADAPNGLGGGVQYVGSVAGGEVWVSEPAGQGLDASWTTYDVTTLAKVGSFGGSAEESFVDTEAGPLVLAAPAVTSACTQTSGASASWCISRVTAQGVMSDPVPSANAVILLGPQPVVIGDNAGATALEVTRLG